MLIRYSATPESHAQACRIMEALCEGFVLAMISEFEMAPDETYPCCVRCGGFCVLPGGYLSPESVEPYEELRSKKSDELKTQSHSICRSPTDMGLAPQRHSTISVRSPRQIVASGGGCTIELACYQAALKRLHGTDPGCVVKIIECDPGTFRAVVLNSYGHRDEEKKGIIDDPVVHANSQVSCSCDPSGVPASHSDEEPTETY